MVLHNNKKKWFVALAFGQVLPVLGETAQVSSLETVIVTSTREEKLKKELAEAVDSFNSETIRKVSPSHPSELLNRSAGVHVNNLGGEGHMTAIRQPITTRGVYLFLEDGVPVRPTGFFNHNALYEVNVPQSGRVEVVKGPGSALYGSDAIGGMINVFSQKPPQDMTSSIHMEAGSYGWKRALLSVGGSASSHAASLSLNLTDNDGYREASDYRRGSASFRYDTQGDLFTTKTLLTYTQVEQSGISSLYAEDYKHNPKKNRFHGDTGFRDVDALRLSSEWSINLSDDKLLSFIPFYRHNRTAMSPSWMVTYDPNTREATFDSFGLLSKFRWFLTEDVTFITGLDVDYTPSDYEETAITHQTDGDIYTGFSTLDYLNYDFEAKQTTLSPYMQLEAQFLERITATLGLRYDYFNIRYNNRLADDHPDTIFIPQLNRPVEHLRPDDQTVNFNEFSPKLGLVFAMDSLHDLYFNYRHAFTMPSVGTLFRSGTTANTDTLKPIRADSIEWGLRGSFAEWLNYETAIYHMVMKDDLVTLIEGDTRNIYNAGETSHQGVEWTVSGDVTEEFAYALAFTRTNQTYESFEVKGVDISGKKVSRAPETIGYLTLIYAPQALEGLSLAMEWEHLGGYYIDETNTDRYEGHDLYHFRAAYRFSDNLDVYWRSRNFTDQRYSTYTSQTVGRDNASYRVGLPATYTAGVRISF